MTTHAAALTPTAARPGATARRSRNPAWMVTALLVGFPVFWAFGLGQVAVSVMAIPMGLVLLTRRPLLLPRGFALWGLFLVWSVAGVLLLGVDPPGYLASSAAGRLVGFGMREVAYLGVTVVLLFIGNLRENELPQRRLVGMLAVFFVVTVIGGVAGLLAPRFEFTSPVEMLLPSSIAGDHYVQNLVRPRLAQVQDLLVDETPRPAAPFAYTNAWSFNLTLLGVWFVAWAVRQPRIRNRVVSCVALGVGIVVLVYSLNRAAWVGAALGVLVVGWLLARRGQFVVALGVVAALGFGLTTVAVTPLGSVVSQRLDAGKSDSIRAFTTEKALELSTQSPVVGLGSTRSTLGSSSSIAVGKSAECPQCGNANIGMNGYLFMLLVTTGFVGTGLFFAFAVVIWWRVRRSRSPVVIAGTVVLVMTAFYSLVYDVSTGLLVPAVTLALLWREGRGPRDSAPEGDQNSSHLLRRPVGALSMVEDLDGEHSRTASHERHVR